MLDPFFMLRAGKTMNSNLYCVVMAGGQGTRFWPESTTKKPKQYLSLTSDKSLLTETLMRFEGLVPESRRYIVTVKNQEALVKENSKGFIGNDGIIFEPSGRNTAPCILLSLAKLINDGASLDDVVAIVPSDHVILNQEGFKQTIRDAADVAISKNKIVTIGIQPHFPHTGFGYIQRGEKLVDETFNVQEFKEKPDYETAKSYIASGKYYWNAGMFMGKIGVLLEEFKANAPETYKSFEALKDTLGDDEKLAEAYGQIPSDSIDYAIMESSREVAVIPAQFDWNDLGSWDALESVIDKKDGNTIAAAKGTYFEEASGNIIYAPGKFVSLLNVEDLIVVSNETSVVVLPKKDSQKVKHIVAHLKESDAGIDLL